MAFRFSGIIIQHRTQNLAASQMNLQVIFGEVIKLIYLISPFDFVRQKPNLNLSANYNNIIAVPAFDLLSRNRSLISRIWLKTIIDLVVRCRGLRSL